MLNTIPGRLDTQQAVVAGGGERVPDIGNISVLYNVLWDA